MKITIVCAYGLDPVDRATFEAMARIPGVELTVIVADEVYPFPGPPWAKLLKWSADVPHEGYRIIHLPLKDPSYWASEFAKSPLKQALRKAHPDVIHVYEEPSTPQFRQIARLCAYHRLCSRVFFWQSTNTAPPLGRHTKLWWATVGRVIAGGNTVNSIAIRAMRNAGYPRRLRIERTFRPCIAKTADPDAVRRVRDTHGTAGKPTVGFIGRIIWDKGISILLAALHGLPDAAALIVGDGPFLSDAFLLAQATGLSHRVRFAGGVSAREVPAYLHSMDILAVPSLTTPGMSEQFGRVIGEAMACGIPVVGSDSGAIPEVIGEAGIIVPEGDFRALHSALQSLLSDPEQRQRIGREGAQRWAREFSPEAMARKFHQLYESSFSGHGA
ncbi:MAG: glycosyltransferase family 4 protein [Nitrospirae bacterium]|nr:glycosyltransferase family 4 protein [Nitrospirota bacterium]